MAFNCDSASRSFVSVANTYSALATKKAQVWKGQPTAETKQLNVELKQVEDNIPGLFRYIDAACTNDAFESDAQKNALGALEKMANTKVLSSRTGTVVPYSDVFGDSLARDPVSKK